MWKETETQSTDKRASIPQIHLKKSFRHLRTLHAGPALRGAAQGVLVALKGTQETQMAPTVEKSQVPQLVESHTPEQLAALKAALEQLGAKLDAAGLAPDGQAEGKDVVDIREQWSDEVHGEAGSTRVAVASSSGDRAGGAAGAATAAGAGAFDWIAGGSGSDAEEAGSAEAGSQDSFEALMQRMDALEVDEALWQQGEAASSGPAAETSAAAVPEAAAAAAAASAASGAKRQQQAATRGQPAAVPGTQAVVGSGVGSGGSGSAKGRAGSSSGFKPGFLLGKRLQPAAVPLTGASKDASRRQQGAASQAPAERHKQEETAAQRNVAFSGRVVERAGSGVAASTQAMQQHERPPRQPEGEQPQPQPQRVSKFKQRRQGHDA